MINKTNLLQQLIRIEMNNFKNICPFIYKTAHGEVKHVNNFIPSNDNKIVIVDSNGDEQSICVTKFYFINGYNKQQSLISHISSKYNYKM